MRRVNDDCVLALVVDNQIGIVVTAAHPFIVASQHKFRCNKDPSSRSYHSHMGIDWICMARVRASYLICQRGATVYCAH